MRGRDVRVLAEIHRRPDLDAAAFREHYERRHVPLAMALLRFAHYRRLHLLEAVGESAGLPDCLSEFGYRDAADFARVRGLLEGAAGASLREDELRFMDKRRNRFAPLHSHYRFADEPGEPDLLLRLPWSRSATDAEFTALATQLENPGLPLTPLELQWPAGWEALWLSARGPQTDCEALLAALREALPVAALARVHCCTRRVGSDRDPGQ